MPDVIVGVTLDADRRHTRAALGCSGHAACARFLWRPAVFDFFIIAYVSVIIGLLTSAYYSNCKYKDYMRNEKCLKFKKKIFLLMRY